MYYEVSSHKPHPPNCRPEPARGIVDSNVMHCNAKADKMPISQTKESFQDTGKVAKTWEDYSGRLNTNFLSHSDTQCISFKTTNSEHFTMENGLKFDRQEQKSLMHSSIPSGDKEKVPFPESEVRGNFKPHSVAHVVPNRFPNYVDKTVVDTLRTDRRHVPEYTTTHKEQHAGVFEPAVKQRYGEAATKRGGHSVPIGDDTTQQHTTNVRDSYGPTHFTGPRYNKSEAVSKVLGTTFLFGNEPDSAGRSGEYPQTTNQAFHDGKSYGRTVSLKPDNVFHSDFPEGDRDPLRTKQLQNDTSYGEHFIHRAPGVILNPKVRGEDLITKSNVIMGTDNVVLSASTQSCYIPQTEHIKPREKVDQLVKFQNGFSIGNADLVRAEVSTVQGDYVEHVNRGRFRHDPVVMGRLKDSHIVLTHDETPEYTSTYNRLFYNKQAEPQALAPHLQSSTVPLGTFSRYITNPR